MPFGIIHRKTHLTAEAAELAVNRIVGTRRDLGGETRGGLSLTRLKFERRVLACAEHTQRRGEIGVLAVFRVRHQRHLVLPKLPVAHERAGKRRGDGVDVVITVALSVPTEIGMHETATIVAIINESMHAAAHHHGVSV